MSSWFVPKSEKSSRVEGDVNICTIYGVPVDVEDAKRQFGEGITRHHIIDIQMLQQFWDAVVARDDDDTMEAMAKWAGESNRLPSKKPYNMQTTEAPVGLRKRFCWNPFNIVVGPLTNVRIGDPGDNFDRILFTSFPAFKGDGANRLETLARQRFNMHIERLARIYSRMKEYVGFRPETSGPAAQMEAARGAANVRSLRSLLVSAVPGAYGMTCDGRGDAKLAMLHPDLWVDYSLTPQPWFVKKGDDTKYETVMSDQSRAEKANVLIQKTNEKTLAMRETHPGSKRAQLPIQPLKAKIVPYVSVSYFPDVPVAPALQHRTTTRTAASLPRMAAMHTVDLDYGLLDRATCASTLDRRLKPVVRFASARPVDLYICAPAPNPMFQDVAANVAEVVADWVATRNLQLRAVRYVGPDVDSLELRAYLP